MKIAFIGLGIMGRPMAGHLKNAGHAITVVERKSLTAEDRAAFAVVPDAKTATAGAEAVILMVPDTPDVEAVLFGTGGVAEGLKPGTLVIDMSSISPTATKEFAAKIAAKGGEYLDAPVSGGEVGAKQASLTIMVGGSEAAFERAKPLFEAKVKKITLGGRPGGGAGLCAGGGDGPRARTSKRGGRALRPRLWWPSPTREARLRPSRAVTGAEALEAPLG